MSESCIHALHAPTSLTTHDLTRRPSALATRAAHGRPGLSFGHNGAVLDDMALPDVRRESEESNRSLSALHIQPPRAIRAGSLGAAPTRAVRMERDVLGRAVQTPRGEGVQHYSRRRCVAASLLRAARPGGCCSGTCSREQRSVVEFDLVDKVSSAVRVTAGCAARRDRDPSPGRRPVPHLVGHAPPGFGPRSTGLPPAPRRF